MVVSSRSPRDGCLPHAALIPIYWNRAWPVRLPLPIIPGVNASAHHFGGFGLRRTFPLNYDITVVRFADALDSRRRLSVYGSKMLHCWTTWCISGSSLLLLLHGLAGNSSESRGNEQLTAGGERI